MKYTAEETVLIIAMLTVAVMSIAGVLVTWEKPELPEHRAMDIEARECIQACIKAMQDNQVFPDFAAIVKECDARYGNGCRLEVIE